jgi:Domain of unknown function (DUF4304)
MTTRDYTSFSRLAGRLMRPICADLGFIRITDIVYAQHHGEVVHLFNLQITRFGGDSFYVNYGASLPKLGVPWFPEQPLKDEGLLIYNRLQTPDKGQGYNCATKASLENSLHQVHADMKAVAVPWFASAITTEQVAALYYDRWDLQPLGENRFLKRGGVKHYAFIQLLLGDKDAALAWFAEARALMTDAVDEDDRVMIATVMGELGAT